LRYKDFEGIIHLHGHVDKEYEGAAGDGFVLSSSAFGRAYLSDGWATSFIRSVLDKYFVVFVGYTADDPPVQYLLEALNSYPGSLEMLYAFQAGSAGEAEAKWRHKGAQAIAYDEANDHKALWDTLAAWASRAKDSDAWYKKVIAIARKGPEVLLPHERGQVTHVVSTLEGVRRFSASDDHPQCTTHLCNLAVGKNRKHKIRAKATRPCLDFHDKLICRCLAGTKPEFSQRHLEIVLLVCIGWCFSIHHYIRFTGSITIDHPH
jgi:SIR2-like domain